MAPALDTLPSAPVGRGVKEGINSDADGRRKLEDLVSGLGSFPVPLQLSADHGV